MWLFTTFGFYSVTQVKDYPDRLQVRARVRGDLDNLRTTYLPELSETVELKGRDYPYRGYVERAALAEAMPKIVMDLTYSNFKSEVLVTQGLARERLYGRVWSVMFNAERKIEEEQDHIDRTSRTPYDVRHPYGRLDEIIDRNTSARIHSEPLPLFGDEHLVPRKSSPRKGSPKNRKKR